MAGTLGRMTMRAMAAAGAMLFALTLGAPAQDSSEEQQLKALQQAIAKSHSHDVQQWNATKSTITSPVDQGGTYGQPNLIQQTLRQQQNAILAIGNRNAAGPVRSQPVRAAMPAPQTQTPAVIIPRYNGPLTVTVAFTHSTNWSQGRARVVSNPAGIDCPSACTATFSSDIDVGLTATADASSIVRPITCSWQASGSAPFKPGNTEGCVLLGRFPNKVPSVTIDVYVDLANSGQPGAITGNGLPPPGWPNTAGSNGVQTGRTNPPAVTFPNTTGGGGGHRTCVPPPGWASCVDLSAGGDGSDFVSGNAPIGGGHGSNSPSGGNGSGSYGQTGGSGQYAAPLSASCISNYWDTSPGGFGWYAFRNTCGQAIHIGFVSQNGTGAYGGSGGSANLAPGASTNIGQSPSEVQSSGGGYIVFVCPAGYIPVSANGGQLSASNRNYQCKKQ